MVSASSPRVSTPTTTTSAAAAPVVLRPLYCFDDPSYPTNTKMFLWRVFVLLLRSPIICAGIVLALEKYVCGGGLLSAITANNNNNNLLLQIFASVEASVLGWFTTSISPITAAVLLVFIASNVVYFTVNGFFLWISSDNDNNTSGDVKKINNQEEDKKEEDEKPSSISPSRQSMIQRFASYKLPRNPRLVPTTAKMIREAVTAHCCGIILQPLLFYFHARYLAREITPVCGGGGVTPAPSSSFSSNFEGRETTSNTSRSNSNSFSSSSSSSNQDEELSFIHNFIATVGYFIVAMFLHETFTYWVHRLTHDVSYLYRQMHKLHHFYVVPVSVASDYSTPIDLLAASFCNMMMVAVLPSTRPLVLFVWALFRFYEVYEVHSGFCFNQTFLGKRLGMFCGERQLFHDFHHTANKGNYGLGFFWDYVCGTDAAYVAHLKALRAEKQKATLENKMN